MSYTASQLTQLLKDAKVKGRSSVRTHSSKLELCKKHDLLNLLEKEKEEKEIKRIGVPELPLDMIRIVIDKIVIKGVKEIEASTACTVIPTALKFFETLMAMSLTCRDFRDILKDNDDCWMDILKAFKNKRKDHMREASEGIIEVEEGNVTARRALQLVTGTGCECCKCPRIRKVHWPFLQRMCRPCLETMTISDYRLEHDYLIKPFIFKGLPFVQSYLYSKYFGQYLVTFYLRDSVVKTYTEKTGKPVLCLEDIKEIGLEELRVKREKEAVLQKEKETMIYDTFLTFHLTKANVEAKSKPYPFKKMVKNSTTFRDLIQMKDLDRIKTKINENEKQVFQDVRNEIEEHDFRDFVSRCTRALKKDNILEKDIGDGHDIIHLHDLNTLAHKTVTRLSIKPPAKHTKKWFNENIWSVILPDLKTETNQKYAKIQEEERRREERRQIAQMVNEAEIEAKRIRDETRMQCPYCDPSNNRTYLRAGLIQHAMAIHKKKNKFKSLYRQSPQIKEPSNTMIDMHTELE